MTFSNSFRYNRVQFSSQEEQDSYVEEREDLIYNLTENENVEETQARIADYEKQNRIEISKNNAQKDEKTKESKKKVRDEDLRISRKNQDYYAVQEAEQVEEVQAVSAE